jgi:hypothetical protein
MEQYDSKPLINRQILAEFSNIEFQGKLIRVCGVYRIFRL